MPRLATVVAGQLVQSAQTSMQEFQQHDAVDVFIGVDVGKGQHHAVALGRNGKRLYNKALPNDETKLRALIAELKVHGRLLFVVDQPATIGALPVAVARDEGILVAYLPGLAMRRIADLHAGEAKTDARDAAIIAEAARSMPHTLRSLRLADEPLAELTMLCGFDDDLAAQITQTSNRIRGLLTQIHPALERVLGPRLDHPAVLDLLERYPSPAALAATSEKTLANRLTKLAPRMGKGLAAEVVQALGEQAVIVPGTQAATIVMPRLAQQLASLRKQRDEIAAEASGGACSPSLAGPDQHAWSRRQDRRQTPHRGRAQSICFGRSLGGLRWPRTGYPALRLIHPWRASIQARQQGAQTRLVSIGLRSLERPHLTGLLRTQGSAGQATQPGAHRTGTATLRRPVRHAARWHLLRTQVSP
jgi:transposase